MRNYKLLGALAAGCLAAFPLMSSRGTAAAAPAVAAERLGVVAFPVSCAASVQTPFNRGVALLHDFWYEEARPQFERILKSDPRCSMAHWGIAMSVFHQIWDRPDEAARAAGWRELEAAETHPAKTAREREYIAALAEFFRPGPKAYEARIEAYSSAMEKLYAGYPGDVDAGAFYALSLLAVEAPTDTSLKQERAAMTLLMPLWDKHPDHPGLVHYIIHACDNPSLAAEGLRRRALTAKSHRRDPMPSICPGTSSPGSAFGRRTLPPTRHRWRRHGRPRHATRTAGWISFIRMISSSTPIFKADRKPKPGPSPRRPIPRLPTTRPCPTCRRITT